MRRITLKQIKKLRFGTKFELAPYPGLYPTRLLVVQMLPEDVLLFSDVHPALKDLKAYKVIYLGKPNSSIVRHLAKKTPFSYVTFEFDRAKIICSTCFIGRTVHANMGPT